MYGKVSRGRERCAQKMHHILIIKALDRTEGTMQSKSIASFIPILILIACSSVTTAATTIATTLTSIPTAIPTSTVTAIPSNTPNPTPTKQLVTDLFRNQALKTLEEGSKLVGMTKTGISYLELGNQLGTFQGSSDLLKSMWQQDFAPNAKTNIEKAIEGWQLCLKLWNKKIAAVTESSQYIYTNKDGLTDMYGDYLDYLGSNAITTKQPSAIPGGSEHLLLPYDANISMLMTMAADYFENARRELINVLE